MALNLWKLGGKPTSYNPLPIGWGNNSTNYMSVGDYIISFDAYSPSSAVIRVDCSAISSTLKNLDTGAIGSPVYTLTPTKKTYVYKFNTSVPNIMYLNDNGAIGDIVVTNIQLVQKPLPKLTINGIDGFTSGKWTLHPNAQAVDDETLVLNATGNFQTSSIEIPISSVQPVSLVCSISGNGGYIQLSSKDANLTETNVVSSGSGNITNYIPSVNAVKLRIVLSNNAGAGQITFKRPMLNLGSIPAPYSKKTGERMVMPVAKKNLITDNIIDAPKWGNYLSTSTFLNGECTLIGTNSLSKIYYNSNTYSPMSARKKTFTGSIDVYSSTGGNVRLSLYSWTLPDNFSSFLTVPPNQWVRLSHTFSFSDSDIGNVGIGVECGNATIKIRNPQLEEGTQQTPYSPYAVQVNKLPQRYVSMKTGILSGWKAGNTAGANTLTHVSSDSFIPIVGGSPYTFKALSGVLYWVDYYDVNKTGIGNNGGYHSWVFTFTPPSNVKYVKVTIKKLDGSNMAVSEIPNYQPQMYLLNGKEGALQGTPVKPNKLSKRLLEAKR